jgi:hypothetical protein
MINYLNNYCQFNKPYEVYLLFAIARAKDNKFKHREEIKLYNIITHKDNIQKQYNELKGKINAYKQYNWRIYLSVNQRDTRKAYYTLKKKLIDIDTIYNEEDKIKQIKHIDRLWVSHLMKPENKSKRGYFLLDIDTKGIPIIKLKDNKKINIITQRETKNGYHIVTEPFNTKNLICDELVEVKKDALLHLEYIKAKN